MGNLTIPDGYYWDSNKMYPCMVCRECGGNGDGYKGFRTVKHHKRCQQPIKDDYRALPPYKPSTRAIPFKHRKAALSAKGE